MQSEHFGKCCETAKLKIELHILSESEIEMSVCLCSIVSPVITFTEQKLGLMSRCFQISHFILLAN